MVVEVCRVKCLASAVLPLAAGEDEPIGERDVRQDEREDDRERP